MAESYRSIAHIQKTHGRNGEVVAVPANGLPPLLYPGLEVFVVPPALKGPRSFVVDECSEGTPAQLVLFEGIRTLGAADKIVGKTLLAHVDDLPDDFASLDRQSLIGRQVHDVRFGRLGLIEEIMVGPTQDVWVVRGEAGEVMIPAVEALVRELPEEGDIVVELPRGLVEGDLA